KWIRRETRLAAQGRAPNRARPRWQGSAPRRPAAPAHRLDRGSIAAAAALGAVRREAALAALFLAPVERARRRRGGAGRLDPRRFGEEALGQLDDLDLL